MCYRVSRPVGIFVDQCTYAVQGIKDEMRIDVRLDRFQLEFPDQCLQLQRVELLLPAFYEVMVKIIEEDPGNNKKYPVNAIGKQPGHEIEVAPVFIKAGGLVKQQYERAIYKARYDNGNGKPEYDLFNRKQQPVVPLHEPSQQMRACKTGDHYKGHFKQIIERDRLFIEIGVLEEGVPYNPPPEDVAPPVVGNFNL